MVILIVDDDPEDIQLFAEALLEIDESINCVEAYNGLEALKVLKRNSFLPNYIFLDINMPIVDGFVFLYEFEKFNELVRNKCKVIILSSSDNKRDIDKIVNNNHVIKFITKPLTEIALDEIKLNNM